MPDYEIAEDGTVKYTLVGAIKECLSMTKGNRLRHRAHVMWIQVGWPREKTRRRFSWCDCCCDICDPGGIGE